jgi:hypothetical protein
VSSRRSLDVLALLVVLTAAACGRVTTGDPVDAAPPPGVDGACAPPMTACAGGCVDTRTDLANCGACGTACGEGEVCAGSCVLACATSVDCPSTRPMCERGACAVPRDCNELHERDRGVPDGVYTIDTDGAGPTAPFEAACDMTTDGGGWTIVAAYSGADGEAALTADATATGDPFRFAHYSLDRTRKIAVSITSTESLLRTTSSWLKVSAPLFDEKLATQGRRQPPQPVQLRASDGAAAPGFMGYVTYDIDGGGDFGISMAPDAATCSGSYTTVGGFDQHSASYRNLNCGCERQYLYGYSGTTRDGDAGYDVNTGLGAWRATHACHSAEGGTLPFYAAMRRAAPSCAAILATHPGAADGVYVIDPDGAGGASSFSVFCDMTSAGGGWTLLLSANATSTYFGNASPTWSSTDVTGTTPATVSLSTDDYKSAAYSSLSTSEIRLCHRDVEHCHVFAHGAGIPLREFFAGHRTYTEHAVNMVGYADRGSAANRTSYLTAIGVGVAPLDGTVCYWLGINQQENQSAIGLMGDNNGGCTGPEAGVPETFVNELAIGVGLQSCHDANGCAPGGSGHHAGHSRRADGVDMSGDLGPWFVFGR